VPQKPTSPAWEKIALELVERIEQGSLAPGDRIPSAQALSDAHKVARGTAVRALQHLTREGYVVSRPGYGTFVAERANVSDPAARLREIAQELTLIADSLK
jgi:DNA-binding GntR family transcriptional regulator